MQVSGLQYHTVDSKSEIKFPLKVGYQHGLMPVLKAFTEKKLVRHIVVGNCRLERRAHTRSLSQDISH